MNTDFVIRRRAPIVIKDEILSMIVKIKRNLNNPLQAIKLINELRRNYDSEFDTELNVAKLYLDQKNVSMAGVVMENIRTQLYSRFAASEMIKNRFKAVQTDIGDFDYLPSDVLQNI